MNKVTILAARSKNNIIGRDNKLPWKLPSDLRRFKELTIGGIVIMGRLTFESLGSKPLPGRQNVVISSSRGLQGRDGVIVCSGVEEAVEKALGASALMFSSPPVFVIGGARVFKAGLGGLATHMILTTLDIECEGSAKFPFVDPWRWECRVEEYKTDNEGYLLDNPDNKGITYTVATYERKI